VCLEVFAGTKSVRFDIVFTAGFLVTISASFGSPSRISSRVVFDLASSIYSSLADIFFTSA